MNCERDILHVLAEAGDKGLSLKKITMHVYNRVNGLFNSVDIEDVRRQIVNYINRVARQPGGIVEHADERGVYRINRSNSESNQLQFDFKDYDDELEEDKPSVEDTSLSLF